MRHILIVDDEQYWCEMLSVYLQDAIDDLSIATVPNGEVALRQIATALPDLLITDLRLPGMTGLEVIAESSEHGETFPVIALTGYASVSSLQEFAEQGRLVQFLLKPDDVEEVVRAVRAVLNASGVTVGQYRDAPINSRGERHD